MFKKDNNTALLTTIVVCTLLISGSVLFLGFQVSKNGTGGNQEGSATGRGESIESYLSGVEADTATNDAVLGNPEAKVTIVEYSDYQCPFCRKYYEEAYQSIKTEYVDTGKVKIIFKDYPLNFHEDAMFAANAAECVREQTSDKDYFGFHDALFEAQGPSFDGTIAITDDMIQELAKDFDLDKKSFNACLEDKKYYSEVAADFVAGNKEGVTGTPTNIINGEVLVGAQPFAAFKEVIERKLAE
jgi:protein-disulfide isomerase